MFRKPIIIRKVSAKICGNKIEKAKEYIKKSVDDYCEINPQKPFSVRILFGGANRDWRKTPLQDIYEKHLKNSKNAKKQAAIDVGWLLKTVLAEDKDHTYDEIKGYTKSYIRLN